MKRACRPVLTSQHKITRQRILLENNKVGFFNTWSETLPDLLMASWQLIDHLWNILCQPIGSKHTNRSTLCIYTCLFVVSRWHKWTRGNYPWPLWPYKTQALLLGFPRRPAGHWSGKARQAVYPLGKSIEATYNVSAFKHKLNNWCGLTTGISHSNTCWLFLETAAEMYIQHMLIDPISQMLQNGENI